MNYYQNATRGPYAPAILAAVPPGEGWFPVVSLDAPAYDLATQAAIPGPYVFDTQSQTFSRPWTVVALTQFALDAASDTAERAVVKGMRDTLAAALDDLTAGIDEASAFIALQSPTAADRNLEVLNAAKRERKTSKTTKDIIRVLRALLKTA